MLEKGGSAGCTEKGKGMYRKGWVGLLCKGNGEGDTGRRSRGMWAEKMGGKLSKKNIKLAPFCPD
jgi:hypothetical protein